MSLPVTGVSPLRRVRRRITSAELLHIVAAPVKILVAPDPDQYYAIWLIVGQSIPGITPYTLNGGSLFVIGGHLADVTLNFQMADLQVGGVLNAMVPMGFAVAPGFEIFRFQDVLGQPIVVSYNNALELTLGDGELDLLIYYSLERAAA